MGDYKSEFIDADEEYHDETQSYESIILKQMQKCVEVLSKEITGGYFTKTNSGEKYEPDVKEEIVNSVNTLMQLLSCVIKKDNKTQIETHLNNIKTKKESLGKIPIFIEGKGNFYLDNLNMIKKDHPINLMFTDYKAKEYREIFGLLVEVYYKNKLELERLSTE